MASAHGSSPRVCLQRCDDHHGSSRDSSSPPHTELKRLERLGLSEEVEHERRSATGQISPSAAGFDGLVDQSRPRCVCQ